MYVFLFYFHDADTPAVCHGMELHEFNKAKHGRREKKRVSEVERERGMRETLRSLNKRIPQLVSDVSRLQVGQQVDAEYVGEMSSGKVASGYGGDGERTEYAISEEGKRFLKILEGSVKNEAGLLIPYNDSNNHATKGYGILLHHGPLTEEDIRDNPPQTEASASADLAGKIAEYESILNNRTSYIYPNNVQVVDKLILTQVEVDALVCLTYNSPRIGKMIVDAIRSGCSDEEMKAIWLDDSDEQSGIGKRRLAEWQLYSRGIYNEKPYD